MRAKERGAGEKGGKTKGRFMMSKIGFRSEARLARVTPRLKSVVDESSFCAAQRRPLARRRAPLTKVKAQPRQSGNVPRRSEARLANSHAILVSGAAARRTTLTHLPRIRKRDLLEAGSPGLHCGRTVLRCGGARSDPEELVTTCRGGLTTERGSWTLPGGAIHSDP